MTEKEVMEMDYYYGNGWLKEFKYRIAFVRFEKDAKSTLVRVLNDGFYVGSFISKANTEKEFIQECESVDVVRDSQVGYRLEFNEGL